MRWGRGQIQNPDVAPLDPVACLLLDSYLEDANSKMDYKQLSLPIVGQVAMDNSALLSLTSVTVATPLSVGGSSIELVRDVSFQVAAGGAENLIIMGTSGCGIYFLRMSEAHARTYSSTYIHSSIDA